MFVEQYDASLAVEVRPWALVRVVYEALPNVVDRWRLTVFYTGRKILRKGIRFNLLRL